jgi:hypothetical protein
MSCAIQWHADLEAVDKSAEAVGIKDLAYCPASRADHQQLAGLDEVANLDIQTW